MNTGSIWIVQAERTYDGQTEIVFEQAFSNREQAENILDIGCARDKSERLYDWSMRRISYNMDQKMVIYNVESVYNFDD